MNDLVSIIITTKNEEKNIPRLLKSIEAQTYKNIEVILVDNKSTDKTKTIAKENKGKIKSLRIFDKGPERSAQRNFGVSKAQGKYVLILDADMELSKDVVISLVESAKKSDAKALVVPEKTVGEGFMAAVRAFERNMYVGDPTIEVARFFERKVFEEFGGYDSNLTGAEDYDLPKRITEKYKLGRGKAWLYHHESQLTLPKQLQKKYYYASKSATYARKHPDVVATQGNMLFRKAYIRHWKDFLKYPLLGISFVFIRLLEATAAVAGYISAVGIIEFFKTFIRMFTSKK